MLMFEVHRSHPKRYTFHVHTHVNSTCEMLMLSVNAGRRRLVLEVVDPALRASKVLRKQHAARDADRYEQPQVIIVDRTDGGEDNG